MKKKVGKQELCEWTSKALQSALTPKNIKAGFRKAGIWPFDRNVVKDAMGMSTSFELDEGGESDGGSMASSASKGYRLSVSRRD